MRVFVTGGTGFIGRYVVRRLLAGKDKILLLARNPLEAKNIFGEPRRLSVVKGDLSDVLGLRKALKKFKPEASLHLAWEGIPDYSLEMSLKNLNYSLNLFKILVEVGCEKIVSSGSCWEYGAKKGKLSEDSFADPSGHQHSPFAVAKVAAYLLGKEIAKEGNIDFVWARLFFVYGPGQKKTSLIPYLISCRKNGILPQLKNPKGGNDFIYADDVAVALIALLKKHRLGMSSLYNIGSGGLTSVQSIADLVYGKKIKKVKRGSGFYADISKIKKEIGWKPKVSIQEGIKRTIAAAS